MKNLIVEGCLAQAANGEIQALNSGSSEFRILRINAEQFLKFPFDTWLVGVFNTFQRNASSLLLLSIPKSSNHRNELDIAMC